MPSLRTLLVSAAALGAVAVTSVPAAARALKLATVAPDGTRWMQEMRAGAAEIAERTAGRVKLKFYPGGVMGNDATVLRKIRAGQLHGGAFTAGSLAAVYPDLEIYGVPFLFRELAEVDAVRAELDPVLRAGLEERGMVVLGLSEGGFGYLMSDTPVSGVEDLQGKKAWIPEGDTIGEAGLAAAGIAPVPLPIGDVYTGLQTGLIDTVAATPTAAIAFQWHTKLRHATDVPLSYLMGVLAVDARAFGKLSPEDQDAVREVMGAVFARLDTANRADNAAARAALEKRGVPFARPDPAQVARWREVGARARAALEAKGTFTPALLQRIDGILARVRGNGG